MIDTDVKYSTVQILGLSYSCLHCEGFLLCLCWRTISASVFSRQEAKGTNEELLLVKSLSECIALPTKWIVLYCFKLKSKSPQQRTNPKWKHLELTDLQHVKSAGIMMVRLSAHPFLKEQNKGPLKPQNSQYTLFHEDSCWKTAVILCRESVDCSIYNLGSQMGALQRYL